MAVERRNTNSIVFIAFIYTGVLRLTRLIHNVLPQNRVIKNFLNFLFKLKYCIEVHSLN